MRQTIIMLVIVSFLLLSGCTTNAISEEKGCSCPKLSPQRPDFCENGIIVPGETDDCGCQLSPRCMDIEN